MIGTISPATRMSIVSAFAALAQNSENLLHLGHITHVPDLGHRNTGRYIGGRDSLNIFGRIKAMASKKPRRESDQANMVNWKPRYPNG